MAFNTTLKHFTSSQELAPLWATGQNYLLNQLVLQNDIIYRCAIAHTSSASFVTDLGAGKWVAVSAAGAEGSKNYIANSDFEDNNTTGWSTFSTTIDSTLKIPTGSITSDPTFTLAASGSTALAGSYSLLASSGAVTITTTGYGFISSAFTIDREDQAKVMGFSFYYEAVSGTMNFSGTSANTFAVYIRDVSGGAWIQPAGVYNLTQSSGVGLCSGTFQTTATGTQYQIAVLMINTVSAGISMRFDDFQLGPQKVVYGSPVTDWVSYTPTVSNATGISSLAGYYRRVGDTVQVRASFVVDNIARSGTSQWRVSIPNNYTPNLSLVTDNGGTGVHGVYELYGDITGATNLFVQTDLARVDAGGIALARRGANRTLYDADFNSIGNAKYISIDIQFPIQGWSSSVQMSQDTDTRVVAVRYKTASAAVTGTPSVVKFTSLDYDTHSSYSSGSGLYTVPVAGKYKISSTLFGGGTFAAGQDFTIYVYKNASEIAFKVNRQQAAHSNSCSYDITTEIDCSAGDTLAIYVSSNATTPTVGGIAAREWLTIERLSGPATIASSETVAMKAYKNTGSHTTDAAWQTVASYNSSPYDTHSSFNITTGEYTVPVSGTYQVSSAVSFLYATGVRSLRIELDGSVEAGGALANSAASPFDTTVTAAAIVKANAGQKIKISAYQNSGGTLSYGPTNKYQHLSIVRVGN